MARSLAMAVLALCSTAGWAQTDTAEIELLHADRLLVNKHTPAGATKLVGAVRLSHQKALLFCDSALLFDNNSLSAQGNVRIEEGDSLTLWADSLRYDGQTQVAKLRGRVKIDNGSSTLTTPTLDYYRLRGYGSYHNGGEIISRAEGIKLVSEHGYYYTQSKLFHYKTNVVLTHPDYTIATDTMHYQSETEKTWFFGPTRINYNARDIYCETGWFDQLKGLATFMGNAEIKSGGQILRADTIVYNENGQQGRALCNVEVIDTAEKMEIWGDEALYDERDSSSKVWGHVLMAQDLGSDTMRLVADTLASLTDSCGYRQVHCYHNVRFMHAEIQGVCDSMVYYNFDSLTVLHGNPLLWSDDNELSADTLKMVMRRGELHQLLMRQKAFIASADYSVLFNQISGNNMVGQFVKQNLKTVKVVGNGQTIYHPREDGGKLIGMNETRCASMRISIDSNKMERIAFYDRPEATLTPSDDMPDGGKKLDGFKWNPSLRPWSLDDLLSNSSTPPVRRTLVLKTELDGATQTDTPAISLPTPPAEAPAEAEKKDKKSKLKP